MPRKKKPNIDSDVGSLILTSKGDKRKKDDKPKRRRPRRSRRVDAPVVVDVPAITRGLVTIPGELDVSAMKDMLCDWCDPDEGELARTFGEDSHMVALLRKDARLVAYLGLCYDPASPFVRSIRDVSERKEAVAKACSLPDRVREPLYHISDATVARALMELLMRRFNTKWALLVAYYEMLYKTVAMSTYLSDKEIAALHMKGKGLADWLTAKMKALDKAVETIDKIDKLLLDVTSGDMAAARQMDRMPDFSASFMLRVLNGIDIDEALDDDDDGFVDEEE
ncbi:MAG: hypothetical protein D6790_21940 [Caldilineae bacterium]|nr:MAG: hypothetical protein D6790_21940 [Caldilineae bacterium]